MTKANVCQSWLRKRLLSELVTRWPFLGGGPPITCCLAKRPRGGERACWPSTFVLLLRQLRLWMLKADRCQPKHKSAVHPSGARRSWEEILRVSRTGLDRRCCGSRRRISIGPFIFAAGRRSMSAGSSQPRTVSMKGQLIALVFQTEIPMEALVGDKQPMTRGFEA